MNDIVLLVDDDPQLLNALGRVLHREKYKILTASSAEEALKIMSGICVSVIVTDQKMPGRSGVELLKDVRQRFPDTVSIMLTGEADMETAIQAINHGQIYRFFVKPCNEVDLALTIREALQQRQLIAQARRLLQVAQFQTSYISQLEDQNPGILQVERTPRGTIVLGDEPYDLEKLYQEAEKELMLAEGRLMGKKRD